MSADSCQPRTSGVSVRTDGPDKRRFSRGGSRGFEGFVAWRLLRAGRGQAFISLMSLLSVTGVAVGVMALVVVIAVMAGFEADLKERLLSLQAHVVVTPVETVKDPAALMDRLDPLEGVVAAAPVVEKQVMLRAAEGAAGVVLRGVDPSQTAAVLDGRIDFGALSPSRPPDNASGAPPLLLGAELARQLGVLVGDRVFLVAPGGMLSPIGHVPSMRPFYVAGIFTSGVYLYDGATAFANLADARQALRMTDSITAVQVRVADIYQAERIAEAISEALGAGFQVRSWMETNRSLFSALRLERVAMFVILALIVLVAAMNIASALIMTVVEKAKDIAILKTLGATDGAIGRIFIRNGVAIGTLGIVIGTAAGLGLCGLLSHYDFIRLPGEIFYVTRLPVRLALIDVVAIAGAALAITLGATLYPARQAARLNPVETIRHG
jgi:lipoprotein-releasing system permease protein